MGKRKREFRTIKLADIEPGENYSRLTTHQVLPLVKSIKGNDYWVAPPIVKPIKGSRGKYALEAGYKRYGACHHINNEALENGLDPPLLEIECEVDLSKDRDELDSLVRNFVENTHRTDMSEFEKGRVFHQLIEGRGYTHAELAKKFGLAKSTVSNSVRCWKQISEECLVYLHENNLKPPGPVCFKIIKLEKADQLDALKEWHHGSTFETPEGERKKKPRVRTHKRRVTVRNASEIETRAQRLYDAVSEFEPGQIKSSVLTALRFVLGNFDEIPTSRLKRANRGK